MLLDEGIGNRRVELARTRMDDQDVGIVLSEILLVLLEEEAAAAVDGGDADEDGLRQRDEAGGERVVDRDIRVGAFLAAPIGDLIEDHGEDRAAPDGLEAIRGRIST